MRTGNEWYLGVAIGSLLVFAVSAGVTALAMYAVLSIATPFVAIATTAAVVSLYGFYRCSREFVASYGSGRRATG
ncbi:hypothetical protein [Halococcus agarilyticus]|uniref:hypothetical protein n=1 Tax=Halococcus agarilyticus TaxID=1232219 RepID=UPI000678203E|nr:hypothetical protein [Halococcus agarilyticus]